MPERLLEQNLRPQFVEGEILLIPLQEFDIKAAVCTSQGEEERLRARIDLIGGDNGYKPNRLPDGRLILLSGREVNAYAFENPFTTDSGNRTDAIYLYRFVEPELEFLMQYLGPKHNEQVKDIYSTSFHGGHGPEYFAVLAGTVYISDGHRARKLTRGQLELLPENDNHICYTLGEPTVTAILKRGDLSHKWLPKPELQDLIRQAKLLEKK